jgi:S-DNA-T family DNA segregation ATPase FtsK/SpoIIIE
MIGAAFSMSSDISAIQFQRGGIAGLIVSDFLIKYVGRTGAWISIFTFGLLSLIVTGEFLITPIITGLIENFQKIPQTLIGKEEVIEKKKTLPSQLTKLKPKINIGNVQNPVPVKTEKTPVKPLKPLSRAAREEDAEVDPEEEEAPASVLKAAKPKIKIAPQDSSIEKTAVLNEDPIGEYFLPSLSLLDDPPKISTDRLQETLMSDAKLLEETLAQFNVSARVADIERGPAITQYELEPAPGVKVQQFTALANDIALAMRAATVRVVAPIPGKNRVGIEVPNGSAASVFLKEVLASNEFRAMAAKSKLTLCLGKDIAGKPMIADLAEMPHMLIAGTTGSGKTVCVNGIIMSILMNASPEEVRFVMVDPKMVEMAQYNDIPHLLCPTVTDSKKAASVLGWVVSEMESRYKKLAQESARNIKAYNAKGVRMPYIVVIVDELADLMQVSAKTVEGSICRLAQLSRAVGIHLILATQRPSVDVITGVIKANFPARISFKVASKTDSRTVLDMNGAEVLLGKGDMLFIKPGDAKPARGQGNYVKDEEINRVVKFIKEQKQPEYDESILNSQRSGGGGGGSDEKDEYYEDAVRVVIETNQASVSILQRRLRLGYTRAARLIDMMEQAGIVGPYCGSKARDILVDREQWLLEHMGEVQNDG